MLQKLQRYYCRVRTLLYPIRMIENGIHLYVYTMSIYIKHSPAHIHIGPESFNICMGYGEQRAKDAKRDH